MENPAPSVTSAAEELVASLRKELADQKRRVRLLDTQLHVLERERQKLAALMHHADAGFVVFDTEPRVRWTNGYFVRGFGHDSHPASFLNSACHQAVCGKSEPCDDCPLRRALASGVTEHHEVDLETHGAISNVYVSAIPIKDMTGEIAEVMVMLQDLSSLALLRRGR